MKNDIKVGLFLVAFSLFLYFYLIPNQISASMGFGGVALGPRYFPRFGTILLGGLSLVLVIQHIITYKNKTEEKKKEKEPPLFDKDDLRVLGIIVTLLVFTNLFQYFNFIVASFVTILSLLYYFGSKRHIMNLILSVSTTAVLYFLFTVILNISL